MEVKLKVLYIVGQSVSGGASTAAQNIILGLRDKIDIVGVVYSRKWEGSDRLEKEGIPCFFCNIPYYAYPPYSGFHNKLVYVPKVIERICQYQKAKIILSRLLRELQPEVIHTNVGPLRIGYYLSKKFNIPHVWHIRERQQEFHIYPFPSENHFKNVLKKTNNSVVSITKALYDYYELEENNSQVVYDGVIQDVTSRPQIVFENSEEYFLFVGAISNAKGVPEIINAFALYYKQFMRGELWLVGKGDESYVNSMKQLSEEKNVSDRIKFLGYRTDVSILMSKALAVIMSSPFEGFGFVTVEAMYNGAIVIGKDSAGTKEQFDNGFEKEGKEIGLRYTSLNGLVNCLADVTRNGKYHYREMLIAAQNTVCSLYGIERHLEQLLDIYKKAVKG